jgi:hypothetical protein
VDEDEGRGQQREMERRIDIGHGATMEVYII